MRHLVQRWNVRRNHCSLCGNTLQHATEAYGLRKFCSASHSVEWQRHMVL